ncbi:MAG TPA: hypothetical protein DIT05_11780 [Morganella sp. (in: Bacteria)]|nr:hypothetical protein [Morganella sp. (in: enterobacteria)]
MNVTEVFHYVQMDCIDPGNNTKRVSEKSNKTLNQILKNKLKNKTGIPIRLIPVDMDLRLFSLQGKTKKLSSIIQRTDVFRTTLPAVLPLNVAIIPEPLFQMVENKSVSARLIPVSISRAEESPRPVMVRVAGHDSPVITQSVTLPVSVASHPAEKYPLTDTVPMDGGHQSNPDNIQLVNCNVQDCIMRVTTKKQADINDVIPALHIEKPQAEYPVSATEHADIPPELRRNTPLPLPAQHGMVEENIKAAHYFSYAFKIQGGYQGEYNETIHIYRKQQQQFILETSSERLKRHLKANIRHGQRESIDIV